MPVNDADMTWSFNHIVNGCIECRCVNVLHVKNGGRAVVSRQTRGTRYAPS